MTNSARVAAAVAVVLFPLGFVGCRLGDRDSYVEANERLFATLPHFPGAKLKSETSAPYSEEDSSQVLGHVTRFDFTWRRPFDKRSHEARRAPLWRDCASCQLAELPVVR